MRSGPMTWPGTVRPTAKNEGARPKESPHGFRVALVGLLADFVQFSYGARQTNRFDFGDGHQDQKERQDVKTPDDAKHKAVAEPGV